VSNLIIAKAPSFIAVKPLAVESVNILDCFVVRCAGQLVANSEISDFRRLILDADGRFEFVG
jgi:hypothetical protein